MPENTSSNNITSTTPESGSLLRAVFDSALDGLVTIDEGGVIQMVNPAVQKIFGYSSEELVGQNVRVLMPEPYRSRHDRYMGRFLATGERRIIGIGREVTGRRRDGSTFPVELAVSQFEVDGQRRFLGLLRDITERKEHEVALTTQLAHQRGSAEVAASILHDFGNALSGIGSRLSNAGALLDETEPADNLRRLLTFLARHEFALTEALGNKVQPLMGLLKAILSALTDTNARTSEDISKALGFIAHAQEILTAYRRYTGTGSGPAPESISVASLLLDAQTLMSDAMVKRGGIIQVHRIGDIPDLYVERAKIMQVLLNLLKNAIEALDEDVCEAPLVDMRASFADGMITIEIVDNGPGFGPEIAEKLFTRGFSTKSRGSGLGLAGCQRIVRSLGGRITLESSGPGCGAHARVCVPARQA